MATYPLAVVIKTRGRPGAGGLCVCPRWWPGARWAAVPAAECCLAASNSRSANGARDLRKKGTCEQASVIASAGVFAVKPVDCHCPRGGPNYSCSSWCRVFSDAISVGGPVPIFMATYPLAVAIKTRGRPGAGGLCVRLGWWPGARLKVPVSRGVLGRRERVPSAGLLDDSSCSPREGALVASETQEQARRANHGAPPAHRKYP